MYSNKEEFIKDIENLKTTKEKGNYFLEVFIDEYFSDKDVNIIDSSGDGGIDAYFTSINECEGIGKWCIIQSKYGTSYKGIDSICGEFMKILTNLEDDSFSGVDNTFQYLRCFIKDSNLKEKSINFFLLTSEKINSRELDAFRKIKDIFKDKYNISIDVDNLYIDLLFGDKTTTCELKLPGSFIPDDGTGEIVGKISIGNLYKLMKDFESIVGDLKLFYKSNVRLYLNNKLSKEITNTLDKEPNTFNSKNNGITILTNGIKYDKDGVLILTDPDCNNGCQTSMNSYKFCKDTGKIPDAKVTATIIDISNKTKEEIAKITECRNRQTAVKSVGSIFVLSDEVGNIKSTLTKKGLLFQTKKGEFTKKVVDFIELIGISFCIDGRPGIAKQKCAEYYNSSDGKNYLKKLNKNEKYLDFVYKLSEICNDLNKPSNIYRIASVRYTQISVLYNLLYRAVGDDGSNYEKYLKILKNDELFNYFMVEAKTVVGTYIDTSRRNPLFLNDYKDCGCNIERLSKRVDLENATELNNLISSWYMREYSMNNELKDKVKKLLKGGD